MLVLFDEVDDSMALDVQCPATAPRPAAGHARRGAEAYQGAAAEHHRAFGHLDRGAQGVERELQAINEELRSTTEELETSKEELQSINEELITVNHELKCKVEETGKINDDLQNLIASTDIATLFVDAR
jgi:two-component system CheB/CheR fusion protein